MEEIATKKDQCSIERFLAMDCIDDKRKQMLIASLKEESEATEEQTA